MRSIGLKFSLPLRLCAMIWCLFGYGDDDDDVLALGGHSFFIVVVYLGILWFILLLLDW